MKYERIFPIMGNKLKSLRVSSPLTQEQIADAMGVSKSQYIKLERGERRLTVDYARRAAQAFGVRTSDVTDENIEYLPVVGRIGASTSGEIIHDTGHGPYGQIIVPVGAFGTEVAVEVEGHSMGIYAPDGSLIIYDDRRDPPTEDMLGEVCVVGLTDGRVLLKRLLRGSRRGLFDLESIIGETIRDQIIEWAAVVAMVIHPRQAKKLRI